MSKQVKEANEKFEGRELSEQSKLKHLAFQFSFVVLSRKKNILFMSIDLEKALTCFLNFRSR